MTTSGVGRGRTPPGLRVALPGERLAEEAVRYPPTGNAAGMLVPDAVDAGLRSVRVTGDQ